MRLAMRFLERYICFGEKSKWYVQSVRSVAEDVNSAVRKVDLRAECGKTDQPSGVRFFARSKDADHHRPGASSSSRSTPSAS